jgi:predicted dehydrogenase
MKETKKNKKAGFNRRRFIKTGLSGTAGAFFAPTILPDLLSAHTGVNDKINIGCIGVGRMGKGDLTDILPFDEIKVIAVCDVDAWRLENAKKQVESHYALQTKNGKYAGCAVYRDYKELLERQDIDAVMIVTPDHWHALPAVDAAKAGKDIFIQKPLTLTIPEGRCLSNTVRSLGRILQVGSQQRSDARFRFAVELVRNGYIGELKTVKVGFGKDPFSGVHPVKPVPEELDYNYWLGPAPSVPYIEERVHPQKSYNRPGWLRTSDYCCGMITGWGSHHLDIAHWGMDTEYTGPTEILGWAEYAQDGVWDVHGAFLIRYHYANGVELICADESVNSQGIRFEGAKGWVFVRRDFIDASPKSLLNVVIGSNEKRLYHSNNHKGNFLECIRSRREPVAPVEIGHRSGSACIIGYIAMRLQRPLRWDPQNEQFIGDEEANRMLNRAYRPPWYL